MAQWQSFWWLPTIMAGVIAVIFFALFWDKMSNYDAKPVNGSDLAEAEAGEKMP
jgi:hypothetical protein